MPNHAEKRLSARPRRARALIDMPDFRRAVLADPQGAAFTVSQLVIASQGA
jgi:hypothetical protein